MSGEGDCVRRARAVAPLIAAAAPRIEAERALPPDVLAALHEARLFRMLLPRSIGGDEVMPADFFAAMEILGAADASAAWCVGQGAGCGMSAAYLAPEAARAVFGAADAVLAWGPLGRDARAVIVDGGFRVSGTWHFASGSRHASWLGAHCIVYTADGQPQRDGEGKPIERTMLFPKARATVTDNWQVMGLKGTGSDSYSVTDLFVPSAYAFARDTAADRRETGALYGFTSFSLYGVAFAGVALGIARTTLDAFIALARDKVSSNAKNPLRENAVIQSQVAMAEAKLLSARGFLVETLHENGRAAVEQGGFTLDQRIRLRLAATWASLQAREVVDAAYHAAGATAIFESNPFERRFRDIHTVSQQVQAHVAHVKIVGQCLLGFDPKSRVV